MEKVKSIIAGKALVYAGPSATVAEAAKMMSQARIGAIIVLEEGELRGIFTERDLLNRVVVPGRDTSTTMISEVMTTEVVVGQADDTYEECLEIMKKVGCRHLPIVDKKRLIGLVSIRDLLLHDLDVKTAEIKMMNYLYYYTPSDLEARDT